MRDQFDLIKVKKEEGGGDGAETVMDKINKFGKDENERLIIIKLEVRRFKHDHVEIVSSGASRIR